VDEGERGKKKKGEDQEKNLGKIVIEKLLSIKRGNVRKKWCVKSPNMTGGEERRNGQ